MRTPSFAIGVVFALLGASACSKPDATPVPTAPRVVTPPTPPSTAFPASMRGQYYKNYSPPVDPNAQPNPRTDFELGDRIRVEEQRTAKWDELSVAGNSLVTAHHWRQNSERPPVTVSVTCTGDGMCSFTGACNGSVSPGNGSIIITASGSDDACQYLTGSWKLGNPVSQEQAPSGGFNPQGGGGGGAGGGGGGEGCIMRCAGDQNACVLRCGTSATESATQACVLECAARGQQYVSACG